VSVVANVAINIDGKQAQSLLKAIQGEVEKLNGTFDEVNKKGKSFGDSIKGAAGSAVKEFAAVAGVVFTLQQAFNTLAEQSRAKGALRSLGVDATVAGQQFARLSNELNGQASAVELTAAAYDVASAGFANVADQSKILEASTKGAVGGMSDLNTVGNAVTSVLNSYGMSASQAALLVDQFIQTQNDGKIILAEYAHQIGTLAPTASAAGVGIDELNAAIGTITAQGVPVESTFTGLNQALVAILKPTEEAKALSKDLGIEFNETSLRTKGFGGLLKEVAKATGGSTTAITQLFGSVDALKVILPLINDDLVSFDKNLRNQQGAAGVSTKAFKDMSNTLNGALKEVDTAFKNLVIAFEPVMPAIVLPFKVLAQLLTLVAQNIKQLAVTATFLATFVTIMRGAVLAMQVWTAATQALATAKKVAAVAAAALQAILNPATLATTALAIAGAAAASLALGAAMDAAAGQSGKVNDESKKLNAEIDQILKKQKEMPKVIESSKDKQEALKEETKTYKEEVDRVKAAYEQLNTAQDQGLNAIENSLKIAQARAQAEQAVNNAIKEQLQTQLEQAKTQKERETIAQRIYQVEVANAESVLALTKLQIQTEIDRAQIAAGTQALLYESLQVELAIARARQQNTTELERALVKQQSALQIAFQNVQAVEKIAVFQRQQAKATFDSQISAAKLAYQQNITAKETAKAAASADSLANGMERAGAAAEKTAQAVNKIVKLGSKSQGAPFAAMGGAGAIEDPALQKQATKIFEEAQKFATGKDFRIQQDIFQRARDQIAQLALRDYAARAKAAMLTTTPAIAPAASPAPASSQPTVSGLSMQPGGGPGTAAVDRAPSTINLQTGPVLQQENGEKYVRLGDLENILQDFAATVFNNARSTGGRRFQGVN
jgi:TP901 family phage tail tape measure protein